jgi:V8-like Glu-specific endopeptidase
MPIGLFILAALSLLACSSTDTAAVPEPAPQTTQDIVGGRSDRGHDPAVVALLLGEEGLCSGSLIGPSLVLTARHCVSETSHQVSCPAHGSQLLGDRDPSTITVLVGDTIQTARPVAHGARLRTLPGHTLCDHDAALIELDRPVDGVTPLVVDTSAGPAAGDLIRAVGFGLRGDNQDSAGRKYTRSHLAILASTKAEFEVGEGICSGDSGGPAIDERSGKIVGIVSRGGPTCQGSNVHNIYTRPVILAGLLAGG